MNEDTNVKELLERIETKMTEEKVEPFLEKYSGHVTLLAFGGTVLGSLFGVVELDSESKTLLMDAFEWVVIFYFGSGAVSKFNGFLKR